MTFLQPLILAALPLIGLPILIHLINQRRYQTIHWAAMMFLLAANRMSRGYARLRQWLIMLFRMLAIAGLIVAVARPLTSGWLGLTAGGRADTNIILLDRSPSMQQEGRGLSGSKLATGRQQLARALQQIGSSHWVLIDSATNQPVELESADALLNVSAAEPITSTADIPSMLQAARDYIQANRLGRTEIWICSDLRHSDWQADSGRWPAIREALLEFPQSVRIHLLAYAEPPAQNVAVRITDVRRAQSGESAELFVSLRLSRERERQTGETIGAPTDASSGPQSIPVTFEIEGARSEVTVELAGGASELKDHRIPLERHRDRGWGKVSIPADENLADNQFYFVFDRPVERRTAIICDDAQAVRTLELAAAIPPEPSLSCAVEIHSPEQLANIEWEKLALVVWQAPLPDQTAGPLLEAFVNRGGRVICFPPQGQSTAAFLGVRWGDWKDYGQEAAIEAWRGDQDLLANTQNGAALPVGQLQVRRYRQIEGDHNPLASLRGGDPLLVRLATDRGGVYFCSTTPDTTQSSLASDGVVLYVLIQRAIAEGAASVGNTRQLVAGDAVNGIAGEWQRLSGTSNALSTEYRFHEGVYASGEQLIAVNRSDSEDQVDSLRDDQVSELFQGLNFSRVDDKAGSISDLVQEIWRLFLFAMIIALLVEALLCLPRIQRRSDLSPPGPFAHRDAVVGGTSNVSTSLQ